jgi:catechol 2,3-dioxygenase-like lactoylglutathione lyase family enzyme
MLDHLEIATRRQEECTEFYRCVLKPFGYSLAVDGRSKGFGQGDRVDFWIVEGDPSVNVHFAFEAPSREVVMKAFELANGHGGTQDREPSLAPEIHSDYFAGYARDPDGRLVEFVCQKPTDGDRPLNGNFVDGSRYPSMLDG